MKYAESIYTTPHATVLLLRIETAFLGSNDKTGNIPQLEEVEVPDDLWGE